MKDQYFGDLGDYKKLSLLKTLRDKGGFRMVVHWLRTENDSRTDGGRIAYLSNPKAWRSYDRELFDFLKTCVEKKQRKLSCFEKSKYAWTFRFFNDYIEDLWKRLQLLDGIRNDKKSNLIFFDPDNGIEIKSTNSRNIHKYVLWNEIETAFNMGKSVLVYQHFPFENHKAFIRRKLAEITHRFSAKTFAVDVKHSVYFLIAQRKHLTGMRRALKHYKSVWTDHVTIINSHT